MIKPWESLETEDVCKHCGNSREVDANDRCEKCYKKGDPGIGWLWASDDPSDTNKIPSTLQVVQHIGSKRIHPARVATEAKEAKKPKVDKFEMPKFNPAEERARIAKDRAEKTEKPAQRAMSAKELALRAVGTARPSVPPPPPLRQEVPESAHVSEKEESEKEEESTSSSDSSDSDDFDDAEEAEEAEEDVEREDVDDDWRMKKGRQGKVFRTGMPVAMTKSRFENEERREAGRMLAMQQLLMEEFRQRDEALVKTMIQVMRYNDADVERYTKGSLVPNDDDEEEDDKDNFFKQRPGMSEAEKMKLWEERNAIKCEHVDGRTFQSKSVKDVANTLGIAPNLVSKVLHRHRKSAFGWVFTYLHDTPARKRIRVKREHMARLKMKAITPSLAIARARAADRRLTNPTARHSKNDPVWAYCGEIERRYDNKRAASEGTKVSLERIRDCLLNRQVKANGWVFSYEDLRTTPHPLTSSSRLMAVDPKNVIHYFNTVAHAVSETGLARASINNLLRGTVAGTKRKCEHVRGWTVRRLTEDELMNQPPVVAAPPVPPVPTVPTVRVKTEEVSGEEAGY